MRIGIVGLPNVGKSTLFNAVSQRKVETSAYPFCTIEPNVAIVDVKEDAFRALAGLGWKEERPLKVTFVDVAGLVEGAHEGQGLGNQFLGKLREMDVLVHVLRCFRDSSVAHVMETVDPARDYTVVEREILLADLSLLDRAIQQVKRRAEMAKRLQDLESLRSALEAGLSVEAQRAYREAFADLQLLSLTPKVLAANVDDPEGAKDWVSVVSGIAQQRGLPWVGVCSKLESEMSDLSPEEALEMREAYALPEVGLDALMGACLRAADWICFYTVENSILGSWRIRRHATAQEAAGQVHSEMAKGFHAAEIMGWREFLEAASFEQGRTKGWVRRVGRDHVIEDGDVLRFAFSG